MILLVCGSRTWTDRERMWWKMVEGLRDEPPTLIHGDARGADKLAGEIGEETGMTVLSRPANWDKYGKAAGRIRNLEMLVELMKMGSEASDEYNLRHWDSGYHSTWDRFVKVLAFYKGEFSPGTQMMIDYCERFGIPVEVIREE